MKKIITFLIISAIHFGCSTEYDDSTLSGRVDNLENRIEKLEELCKQMNTNISSLQILVDALQNKDYITGIVPITKDGETIGYTISFTKSAPITIYNGQDGKDGQDGKPGEDGKDGKDGSTPVIGVKQDTDGIYYWTLNGTWLTDGTGNKIKAEGTDGQNGTNGNDGTDGKDGTTPVLKIVDGFWYVSTDNGSTWVKLGQAIGDKGDKGDKGDTGESGGDSIFKSVADSEDCVIFTLQDGTVITIPRKSLLNITLSISGSINVLPNKTYEINYTLTGADANTTIDAIAQNGYRADVVCTDYQTGKIIVTTPDPAPNDRVIILVSDGKDKTIMRSIYFAESVIIITDNSVEIPAEGDTVMIGVETNVAYTVTIPELDQSWISLAETRAATHNETLTFTVQPNPNTTYRYSTITLNDESGLVAQSILFAQKASGYKTVHVATAGTLETYLTADEKDKLIGLKITGTLNTFDYDFLRTMPALKQVDIAQITNTTIPPSCFKESTIETVILPLNLTAIPDNAFNGSAITSISIPSSVKGIGENAFHNCTKLSGALTLPEKLEFIGNSAFEWCCFEGELIIPNSVTSIGKFAFRWCEKFTGTLTLSSELTIIPEGAFSGCSGLTGNLIIPDKVTVIDQEAFCRCVGFSGYLTIGEGAKTLGKSAFTSTFYNSSSCIFNKVYCKATVPPTPYRSAFVGISDKTPPLPYLGVPIGCKEVYQSSWTRLNNNYDWIPLFDIIEEIEF